MSKSLAIAYSMKRKKKAAGGASHIKKDELKEMPLPEIPMAKGGEVDPMTEVTCPHCAKSFSHGGQVANDEGEGAAAEELPNEFDDLVLRDNEELEGYTGEDSGDLIGRAMAKRKAKKA